MKKIPKSFIIWMKAYGLKCFSYMKAERYYPVVRILMYRAYRYGLKKGRRLGRQAEKRRHA